MSALEEVQNHLKSGGVVLLLTHYKTWIYDIKWLDRFGEDEKGFLTIRHGKRVDSLKYSTIRLSRWVENTSE